MNIKTIKNDILGGEFLAKDIIAKQFKLIVLIVAMAIFYISNRYTCLQKISDINRLKRELTDAKFESLTRSSELMAKSKQSQVQKMISDRGVELEASKTPPYILSK